jgi:AraC-like DNA-binding protein
LNESDVLKQTVSPHRLRLFLWHGYAIWVGEGLAIAPHVHVAHQLSVGLDRPYAHQTADGTILRGDGFVCPSGVPHGFYSEDSLRQILFWSEPYTWEGRQVAKRFPADRISVLSRAEVDRVRDALREIDLGTCGAGEARRARDLFYGTLFGQAPSVVPMDPRIARATEFYFHNRARAVTVVEAAKRVGLSQAHFSRLFAKTVGVPPARYRLWMRALEGVRLVLAGESVTDAAHGAGFSDGAHFTRTYNRLLGSGGPRANMEKMEMVVCDERWLHAPHATQ